MIEKILNYFGYFRNKDYNAGYATAYRDRFNEQIEGMDNKKVSYMILDYPSYVRVCGLINNKTSFTVKSFAKENDPSWAHTQAEELLEMLKL